MWLFSFSVFPAYAGFAICLYIFYILSPITMKFSSAIVVNLSVLTGNIYSLFWALFLFDYEVSACAVNAYVKKFYTVPTASVVWTQFKNKKGHLLLDVHMHVCNNRHELLSQETT